jgi:hypothetical protein
VRAYRSCKNPKLLDCSRLEPLHVTVLNVEGDEAIFPGALAPLADEFSAIGVTGLVRAAVSHGQRFLRVRLHTADSANE